MSTQERDGQHDDEPKSVGQWFAPARDYAVMPYTTDKEEIGDGTKAQLKIIPHEVERLGRVDFQFFRNTEYLEEMGHIPFTGAVLNPSRYGADFFRVTCLDDFLRTEEKYESRLYSSSTSLQLRS